MSDIVVRLAKACAHGVRQAELVDELLSGPTYIKQDYFGFRIGTAKVGYESWKSLKKRLMKNGFVIHQETFANKTGPERKIVMKFEINFTSSK